MWGARAGRLPDRPCNTARNAGRWKRSIRPLRSVAGRAGHEVPAPHTHTRTPAPTQPTLPTHSQTPRSIGPGVANPTKILMQSRRAGRVSWRAGTAPTRVCVFGRLVFLRILKRSRRICHKSWNSSKLHLNFGVTAGTNRGQIGDTKTSLHRHECWNSVRLLWIFNRLGPHPAGDKIPSIGDKRPLKLWNSLAASNGVKLAN